MQNNYSNSPLNDLFALANLDPILNGTNQEVAFFFSKYSDASDSYGKRTVIEIHKKDLTVDVINNNINELKSDEELSILSLIKVGHFTYHIPMIDFLAKKRTESTVKAINETSKFWNITFNIYNSGRSIHAYGTKLLSQNQWINFMGYLILLNKKSGEKVTDVRWIGHRLMSGYSSLRITNNTNKYKAVPTYIGSTTGDILY
ncbi:Uncharacterised protein [Serratia proteamaculans]|nr:Uncharacterised protein [Serratia proteamaculans]